MYDTQQLAELRGRVEAGIEQDPTPFGLFGDHCPFCGHDWKQPHDEWCESPHNTVERWDALLRRRVQVNPNTAILDPGRYPEDMPAQDGRDAVTAWREELGYDPIMGGEV